MALTQVTTDGIANAAITQEKISSSVSLGGGGAQEDVFYENSQTLTTSYTITSGKSALTAGPVTIATGAVVTIPNGSRWVIL